MTVKKGRSATALRPFFPKITLQVKVVSDAFALFNRSPESVLFLSALFLSTRGHHQVTPLVALLMNDLPVPADHLATHLRVSGRAIRLDIQKDVFFSPIEYQ